MKISLEIILSLIMSLNASKANGSTITVALLAYLTALTTLSTVTVEDAYTDISPSSRAR